MSRITIPAGTTVKFIRIGNKDYALTPLGQTAFISPTNATHASSHQTTYGVEYEIELDEDKKAYDSSAPPKVFMEYIGGRPTGR